MVWEISSLELWFMIVGGFTIIIAIISLISRLRALSLQLDSLLQEKDVIFNFVYDIGEVFVDADSVDLSALLKRVLSYAVRSARAGGGALYLLEPDGETLRPHAVAGVFPPIVKGLDAGIKHAFSKVRYVEEAVRGQSARWGEGLVGRAAALNTAILISDGERDERVPRFEQDFLQVHSILLVPMRFRHEVLGVLAVVNRVDDLPFIEADENLLQALADQAAVSVHYAKFSVALEEKQRLDKDLGVATRIQTALLPKEIPDLRGGVSR